MTGSLRWETSAISISSIRQRASVRGSLVSIWPSGKRFLRPAPQSELEDGILFAWPAPTQSTPFHPEL